MADAAQVEGFVPSEGGLVYLDSFFLELLLQVVEEALGAAWGSEALGEVGVGVEEDVAAADSGGVHLDVLHELLGDLVGSPLVALLVADEADQDVLDLFFFGAGGLLGDGCLLFDLVAELGAVELEYSHFDTRLFTSVPVLDSFRLCAGWGPPPLFLGVGFGVFLGVFWAF